TGERPGRSSTTTTTPVPPNSSARSTPTADPTRDGRSGTSQAGQPSCAEVTTPAASSSASAGSASPATGDAAAAADQAAARGSRTAAVSRPASPVGGAAPAASPAPVALPSNRRGGCANHPPSSVTATNPSGPSETTTSCAPTSRAHRAAATALAALVTRTPAS